VRTPAEIRDRLRVARDLIEEQMPDLLPDFDAMLGGVMPGEWIYLPSPTDDLGGRLDAILPPTEARAFAGEAEMEAWSRDVWETQMRQSRALRFWAFRRERLRERTINPHGRIDRCD
jgi:hypothetical protein